ncbi:Protein of unknown function [Pyronema omphalodes CBS 100304]|uniref:Uncharacterized protein n=1 Tax=Pyronema omphalodes (strain CBS 100304) TaxID=1076935 RepID=U4LMA9_PYROM|nr:Protein of unknown function [Pyronema omphalodes CBS 100304]
MSAPPTPRLRLSRPGDPSRPTQPLKSALSTPTKRKRPVLEDDLEEPPESLEDELESMSLDPEVSMGMGMEEDTDTDLVGYTQPTQQHLTVPGTGPGPAKRRREQRSASEPRRGLNGLQGLQGLRGLTPPRSPEQEQGMQRKRLRSPPPEPAQEELELEQEEEMTDAVLVKSTPLQKYARALRRKEQIQNYKSREIKESREKRTAERRRRRSQSNASRAVELEAINAAANARLVVDSPQKKVQFIV